MNYANTVVSHVEMCTRLLVRFGETGAVVFSQTFFKNLTRLHVLVVAYFYAASQCTSRQLKFLPLCALRTIRLGGYSRIEFRRAWFAHLPEGGVRHIHRGAEHGYEHFLRGIREARTDFGRRASPHRRRSTRVCQQGGSPNNCTPIGRCWSATGKSQDKLVFCCAHFSRLNTWRANGRISTQHSAPATEGSRLPKHPVVLSFTRLSTHVGKAQLNLQSLSRLTCGSTHDAPACTRDRHQLYAYESCATLVRQTALLYQDIGARYFCRPAHHLARMNLPFLLYSFANGSRLCASEHSASYSKRARAATPAYSTEKVSIHYPSYPRFVLTNGSATNQISGEEKQLLDGDDFFRGNHDAWSVCVDSDWKTYPREHLLSRVEEPASPGEARKTGLALYDVQRFPADTLASIPSSGRLHTEQMRGKDAYLERVAGDKAASGDDEAGSRDEELQRNYPRKLTWRNYLSWLPPPQPPHNPLQRGAHRGILHDSNSFGEGRPKAGAVAVRSFSNETVFHNPWDGFPPSSSTKLDDLPLETLVCGNETLLYRQAFKDAPAIIDNETFERLRSRWTDAEELKRVQREEKGIYGIPEDVPDDCWIPISPHLPEGRLVQEYGLVPNITLTEGGYDYIETYYDPTRNYTWAYKKWNPLKQEGVPPRNEEGDPQSIYDLDTEKSRRYWHEAAHPPPLQPDDGIFRQTTVADEMIKGMKRTPLGTDQWHYTPTHPLGQTAELQNFWLTAVKRTLSKAKAHAEAEAAAAAVAAAPAASGLPEQKLRFSRTSLASTSERALQTARPLGGRHEGAEEHAAGTPSSEAMEAVSCPTGDVLLKSEEAGGTNLGKMVASATVESQGRTEPGFCAHRSAYQPLVSYTADHEDGGLANHTKYRQLGKSDLFVSEVGLGTMTVGSPQLDEKSTHELLTYAVESWGINFIDTAELYPLPVAPHTYGRAEEIIGRWLRSTGRRSGCRREEVVIATKVAGPSSKLAWLRTDSGKVLNLPGKAGSPVYQQPPEDAERVRLEADQLFIASKAERASKGPRGTSTCNDRGANQLYAGTSLSKAQIVKAAEGSIRRLQTDYIDLFQLHWPDRYVPMQNSGDAAEVLYDPQAARHREATRDAISMEEQLEAIEELLRQGKIRAWGLSNETPYGTCHFTRLATKAGLPPPASVQLQYNLLCRNDVEKGYVELARPQNAGIGLLAYGALAGGILTGKYLEWLETPTAGRLLRFPSYMRRYRGSLAAKAVASHYYLALRFGHPNLTVMALRWIFTRPFICSTLLGVTSYYQLRENLYCTQSGSGTISDWMEREINFLHWKWRDPLRIIQ